MRQIINFFFWGGELVGFLLLLLLCCKFAENVKQFFLSRVACVENTENAVHDFDFN